MAYVPRDQHNHSGLQVGQDVDQTNEVDAGNASDLGASKTRFVSGGRIPPVETGGFGPTGVSASDRAYGDGSYAGAHQNPKGVHHVGKDPIIKQETGHDHRFTDGALEVDKPEVQFKATKVGDSSKASLSVTNPDREPHTLAPTHLRTLDPFHDFKVLQFSNEVVPPGESRTLDLEFSPSRSGTVMQGITLATDNGLGPGAQVHLSGTGIDDEYYTTEERIADQDKESDFHDAHRKNDPVQQKRVEAKRAVTHFAKRVTDYNDSLANWTRNNWEEFLGKTGGDVHIAEPGKVGTFMKKMAVKGAGKFAKVESDGNPYVEKGVEWVVNKVLNKVTELIWDKMSGEKKPPSHDEVALQATKQVAHKSIQKGLEVAAIKQEADLVVSDSESGALLRITEAKDGAELDSWISWAKAEESYVPKALDAADTSLAQELLSTWTQERAATPTKANSHTNSAAWNEARKELKQSGKLPTLERNDLFIHQCRNEWSQIGARTEDIEKAAAELEQTTATVRDELRGGGITDPADIAVEIQNRLGSQQPIAALFHQAQDPQVMRAAFESQQYQLSNDGPEKDHFARPFGLTCYLNLKTSGAAVYVDRFTYVDSKFGHFWRKP